MSSLTTKSTKSRSTASQKSPAKPVKKTVKKEIKKPLSVKSAPKIKKAVIAKVEKPVSGKAKNIKTKATKKAVAPVKNTSAKKPLAKKVASKAVKAVGKKAAAKKPVAVVVPQKKALTGVNAAAVHAFEQALKLFNRHDYSAAKEAFDRILDKFADQTEVISGVRKYLAICEQRLARTPSTPKNPDALYDQGVYELNRANVREAIQLLEKALKAQPKGAHIGYSLAAAYARLGEIKKALDYLRQAIQLEPVHRSRARSDADFLGLHGNEDFQQLTGFGIGYFDE